MKPGPPPASGLLGSHAVQLAGQAEATRAADAERWREIKVSTDVNASGSLPALRFIQAAWSYGQKGIHEIPMQILAKRLQRQVKTAVKRFAPFAPAWSQPVLSQIAVSPAHKDNFAKRNAAERQLGQCCKHAAERWQSGGMRRFANSP
jgi:hypothetical protein